MLLGELERGVHARAVVVVRGIGQQHHAAPHGHGRSGSGTAASPLGPAAITAIGSGIRVSATVVGGCLLLAPTSSRPPSWNAGRHAFRVAGEHGEALGHEPFVGGQRTGLFAKHVRQVLELVGEPLPGFGFQPSPFQVAVGRAFGTPHQIVERSLAVASRILKQHHGVEWLDLVEGMELQVRGTVCDPHPVPKDLDPGSLGRRQRAEEYAHRRIGDFVVERQVLDLPPLLERFVGPIRLFAGKPPAPCTPAGLLLLPDPGQPALQRVAVDHAFRAQRLVGHVYDHLPLLDCAQEVHRGHADHVADGVLGMGLAEAVEAENGDHRAGILDQRDLLLQQLGDGPPEPGRLEVESLFGDRPVAVGAATRAAVFGRVRGDDGVTADHMVLPPPAGVEHIAQIGRGEGGEMSQAERSGSLAGLVAVALRQHGPHSLVVQSDPVVATEEHARLPGLRHLPDSGNRVVLVPSKLSDVIPPLAECGVERCLVFRDAGNVIHPNGDHGEVDLRAPFGADRGVQRILQELAHDALRVD